MPNDAHRLLQNLAHAAWVRRGKPLGSPEVDWEEAKRLVAAANKQDEETLRSAPGGTPTDLGAELVPERSHDQP